jgi:tungstate transport system ATP-binding protein
MKTAMSAVINTAMLSIQSLKKSFGERQLLNIANVTLTSEYLHVLTGDNGSGKTTLLRILAGLESADAFSLSFENMQCDASANYPAAWRKQIIHVHQHPYLFHSSIADNIGYGLKMRGVKATERQPLIEDAMAWAGLTTLANVPPKRLSGGERQKVALARAKVLQPQVLLVDEPTANLDGAARTQIAALLKQFVDEGRIVVVASHDQEIMALAGTSPMILEDGVLKQS